MKTVHFSGRIFEPCLCYKCDQGVGRHVARILYSTMRSSAFTQCTATYFFGEQFWSSYCECNHMPQVCKLFSATPRQITQTDLLFVESILDPLTEHGHEMLPVPVNTRTLSSTTGSCGSNLATLEV